MKILISIVRFIVGVLFIFSGLVKANDPLGLSYKMQEFFEVWNFHWLDNFTLAFSILMIAFEIVAGVAVLLGWQMKLFSWLLLVLIVFFTFLTGYAYLSGKVQECGCFGDCIPLTAGQSFTKDLLLLVLILFLFAQQKKIGAAMPRTGSLAVLILSTLLSFSFMWYVLIHLPVVDCLPYRVGANIPDKLKPPPDAIQDSVEITLIYEKGGREQTFRMDSLPDDLDTYKFIRRKQRIIRQGNATAAIKDFALITASGTDTTQEILDRGGYKIFFFTKGFTEGSPDWMAAFTLIHTMAKAKHIPIYFITGDYENVSNWTNKTGIGQDVTVLKCDVTAIKTAARAYPTLYLLKKGVILHKWSYADLERALPSINELPNQEEQMALTKPL